MEKKPTPSNKALKTAIKKESDSFQERYLWMEKEMPSSFFSETESSHLMLVTHSLMVLDLHHFFSIIHLKNLAIVLCLDSEDSDIRILKHFNSQGIKSYATFCSKHPAPFPKNEKPLKVAFLKFTSLGEEEEKDFFSKEEKTSIKKFLTEKHPEISSQELESVFKKLDPSFFNALDFEDQALMCALISKSKSRDHCQYALEENEKEKKFKILLAWRNTPKHHFLYRLSKVIFRHGLRISHLKATYIDPYSHQRIALMAFELQEREISSKPCDVKDLLQEILTLKYFEGLDNVEHFLVDPGLVRGALGNLIRALISLVHQTLTHLDPYLYSLSNVEEGFLRHPELTVRLCEIFEHKFHPEKHDFEKFKKERDGFFKLIDQIDTGQVINDTYRKNILRQAMNCIDSILKTNFYRTNISALAFRLSPEYLDTVPYDRKGKFPELPFAIFFIKGMHFIGFHIRFKDIARGGLRTVIPEKMETMLVERNFVFSECYNLALTQQKKNKDIPEGGAKAIILLEPYDRLLSEVEIYRTELEEGTLPKDTIEQKIKEYRNQQKKEYLYQAQRTFVYSLLTLVNSLPDGTLRAKDVIDYYKASEYIYLGPDENMQNEMIDWIAEYSKQCNYALGSAFITSKPKTGINHKEYGVTSLGVNVCMEEVLKFMGIDPTKQPFSVKISGGPDGDVAGNEILNLSKLYPKNAKLLALIDVSGTIFDPQGVNLEEMKRLFEEGAPIRNYSPEFLSEGGFLLDAKKRRVGNSKESTLLWKLKEGQLVEEWISSHEMHHLLRYNVHQTKTDIFIPAGGRPRTLSENNIRDFLDVSGQPTSRGIIEGANLYLTHEARRVLEKLGVLIIRDSSANKGGVICSSFEVLCGLTLSEEEFIQNKPALMEDILLIIEQRAREEACLMLRTHKEEGRFLTEISEDISLRINTYKYELLEHFKNVHLEDSIEDPLIQCLMNYCPSFIRKNYPHRILERIPDIHKKAIISCHIASRLVYFKGLQWHPTLVDVLPLVVKDPLVIGNENVK